MWNVKLGNLYYHRPHRFSLSYAIFNSSCYSHLFIHQELILSSENICFTFILCIIIHIVISLSFNIILTLDIKIQADQSLWVSSLWNLVKGDFVSLPIKGKLLLIQTEFLIVWTILGTQQIVNTTSREINKIVFGFFWSIWTLVS